MARRTQSKTSRGNAAVAEPEDGTPVTIDAQGGIEPAEEEAAPRTMDVNAYLKEIPRDVRNKAIVYVYRLQPKVRALGANKYIARYSGQLFTTELLEEEHGGGKFKLMLDCNDDELNGTFYYESSTPAKIYPEFVMVDTQGNPLPTAPAAAPTAIDRKTEIAEIVATVIQGMQSKGLSMDQAIGDAMAVMKQANITAVDILGAAAKQQIGNPQGGSNDTLLREVLQELKNPRRDPLMEKLVGVAVERLISPAAAPAGSMFGGLKGLAEELGVDGGAIGLIKTVAGSGTQKTSWWEEPLKDLVSGLSTAIRENAPALLQWMRERAYQSHIQTMMARQAAGQPAANAAPAPQPVPTVQTPQAPSLPRPAAAPAAPGPAAPGNFREDEAMEAIRQQIVNMIAFHWNKNMDGESTAIAVKAAFSQILPILRANFKDLEALKEFASKDPVLASITQDPEFEAFAEEFFKEFHTADNPPPSAP